MVLACISVSKVENLESQSQRHLLEALLYVIEAKKIQSRLNKQATIITGQSLLGMEEQKQRENSVTIAYRYFTHGIITMNYFILH